MASRWARILLPLLVLLAACPGRRTAIESGPTECADGLDNDDDGRIDCKDSDCYPLAFCSGTDTGPINHDGPLQPPPDKGPTPDIPPPQPDLPPPSSYGHRCEFKQKDTPCADGQTVCIPGNYNTSGFCTHPCPQNDCPPGPSGTKVHCGFKVNYPTGSVWYCVFTCSSTSCPHDTTCFGSFCF